MANGINKVILIGNLGADPEMRQTQNGTPVANLSLATSDTWKDKQSGEKKQATEWHRVAFFGPVAEIASKYLTKGSKVYVEGAIRTNKYTDKEGVERYSTEIMGRDMQMLGEGGGSSQAPQGQSQGQDRQPATTGANDDLDDDIPF